MKNLTNLFGLIKPNDWELITVEKIQTARHTWK